MYCPISEETGEIQKYFMLRAHSEILEDCALLMSTLEENFHNHEPLLL